MEEQKLLRRKNKALSDGNKTLLITACINLAEHYFQQAKYELAIREYKILAETYKEMDKLIDFAKANRMVGEGYTHLREYNKALQHQEIHLNVSKQQHDKLEQQRALATIGHTYLTSYLDAIDFPDKKALELAYASFTKSLAVCNELKGISKREHMDMTARLFANLGVVQECLENYDKGIELIQRSINICKTHDIYEQLERGYSFLGTLYLKKGEYNNAIHNYNLAIEVASRLEDKVTLMSVALTCKADILIKLADYHGAKTVLLKAYKLKNPNKLEQENVEQMLKVVAALCYAEDSLLTTGDTDYKSKKKLYEKMGDGASFLKNYSKAIEYYQKMLESAINDGDSEANLCPCYISLAQSYSDNKQYDLAIHYFKKEFSVNKNNIDECISTLFTIAETLDLAKKDTQEIEDVYIQALNQCRDVGNTHLEGKTLIRYIKFLQKYNKCIKLKHLEKQLSDLNYNSSESESEDEQQTPNVGDDICVDDITDISDGSDSERDLRKPRATRKHNKGFVIKRNNKGETQLHTACISGNSILVQRLLDQGHAVNVRDNCGWLPIHEACICGHIGIVKLLLDKGAAINDRGGTLCHGMTPLHDAASNGHLEIIELMLDRGASAIAKTDDGETPLHILQRWYKTVQLNPIQQSFYEQIIERMMQTIKKSVHERDIVVNNKENVALVLEPVEGSKQLKQKINDNSGLIGGNLRRHVDISQFDNKKPASPLRSINTQYVCSDESSNDTNTSVSSSSNSDSDIEAKNEYKKVMANLRSRSKESTTYTNKTSNILKRPALLELDEVGDDWLEDDLLVNVNKKRKTSVIDNYVETHTGISSSSSSSLMTKCNSYLSNNLTSNKLGDESIVPESFFEGDFEIEKLYKSISNVANNIKDSDEAVSNSLIKKSNIKKKTQTSLISSGFTCNRASSPNNFSKAKVNVQHKQARMTDFTQICNVAEADSTTTTTSVNLLKNNFNSSNTETTNNSVKDVVLSDPMLSVDVCIDGRLFRVPVPLSEIHSVTIKWLAEEAAKRYCRKECMKPTLELETRNGAVLADDDLVSILFPLGGRQSEEVNAKVLKWNLPPLIERYKEACANMNIDQNEKLLKVLHESSRILDLSDFNFRFKILNPICKAINRQSNLHCLNLSGNFMMDENMQLLCSSLPNLEHLSTLNLSLNHLGSESISYMANMFIQSDKNILENLITLDLSFNSLKDESLKYLAIITRHLKLRTLKLKHVEFTSHIFDHFYNRNIVLYLDYLECLDISFNKLNKNQILKFITWLKPKNIQMLDVSSNNVTQDGLTTELVRILETDIEDAFLLKNLNLSRCLLTDTEVYELLRLLSAQHFENLNLSYNENLTAITLRRIIQYNGSLLHLDLSGCVNIFKYFENCAVITQPNDSFANIETLKLYADYKTHIKDYQLLINMWKAKSTKHHIHELRNVLHLSIQD